MFCLMGSKFYHFFLKKYLEARELDKRIYTYTHISEVMDYFIKYSKKDQKYFLKQFKVCQWHSKSSFVSAIIGGSASGLRKKHAYTAKT